MNSSPTKNEREYLAKIKSLPCSVCNAPAPSEAHHIKQSSAWICVALCKNCHTGNNNGIHGLKCMWVIMKMDELDALSVTIKRMNQLAKQGSDEL